MNSKSVARLLREPDKYFLTAIYGLGGIGKTALAREAADLLLREGRFQQVVWLSAKTEKFGGVGIEKVPVSDLTFDSLLDHMARQCRLPDQTEPSPMDTWYAVQTILASRPVLIVLDNLETVPDCEALVSLLADLLRGPSKALLTSRHEIKHTNVHTLRLGGLDQCAGITFLQEEGRGWGLLAVAEAPQETLVAIYQATGGAPLAMKLVIGQLSRQPLDRVLQSLQEAAFEGQDYPFYRFVFKHSWDLLSVAAKKPWCRCLSFYPAIGGQVRLALQVSRMSDAVFYSAMDEVIRYVVGGFDRGVGQPPLHAAPIDILFHPV